MKAKVCGSCNKSKPLSEFTIDRKRKDGRCFRCKDCAHAKNLQYRQDNPDWHIKRRYGLTTEAYNQMLQGQGGVCKVCGRLNNIKKPSLHKTRPLFVDHDHETGLVRGLLCHGCNAKIGVIENKEWMSLALNYLQESRKP